MNKKDDKKKINYKKRAVRDPFVRRFNIAQVAICIFMITLMYFFKAGNNDDAQISMIAIVAMHAICSAIIKVKSMEMVNDGVRKMANVSMISTTIMIISTFFFLK